MGWRHFTPIYHLENRWLATPISLGLSLPLTNRHRTWEWLAIYLKARCKVVFVINPSETYVCLSIFSGVKLSPYGSIVGAVIGSMDRWTKGSSKGAETSDLTQERPTIQLYADNIYIYIPRTQLTSVFEDQPSKNKALLNQNKGHLGSRYTIYCSFTCHFTTIWANSWKIVPETWMSRAFWGYSLLKNHHFGWSQL